MSEIKASVYLVLAQKRGYPKTVRVVRHGLKSPHIRQGEFAVQVTITLPPEVFQRTPPPRVEISIPAAHVKFPPIAVESEPVQLPETKHTKENL